jgi:monoterpene epsilon-lactone hydrolase
MARAKQPSKQAAEMLADLESRPAALPERSDLPRYRRETRAAYEPWVEEAIAGFAGEIKDLEIAGVACKQLTPEDWSQQEDACIQYAYGGGYVSGSTYEDLIIALPLAQFSNARVVMVDYRLSPEHCYPAPQQDMQRVYPILADVYGAERLAVCGESAGGNQALGLLLHIRNNGLMMPACAALLSPWCDLADPHDDDEGQDPTLNKAWVRTAASWHAGGHALDDPGISPIYGELSGLPPTLITTGSRDLLCGMSERLAGRLGEAGVECRLEVGKGLWHVYEFYPIPEAEKSIRGIADFIRAHAR